MLTGGKHVDLVDHLDYVCAEGAEHQREVPLLHRQEHVSEHARQGVPGLLQSKQHAGQPLSSTAVPGLLGLAPLLCLCQGFGTPAGDLASALPLLHIHAHVSTWVYRQETGVTTGYIWPTAPQYPLSSFTPPA